MVNKDYWSTSVTELMTIFHQSLVALVPCMEKAKVKWNDIEAYDDWDEISQVLFKNLVLKSLEYSKEIAKPLVVPDYGTLYPSYHDKSLIELTSDKNTPNQFKVFVGFSTNKEPFDQAKYVIVSSEDFNSSEDIQYIDIDLVQFSLVLLEENLKQKKINSLSVEL